MSFLKQITLTFMIFLVHLCLIFEAASSTASSESSEEDKECTDILPDDYKKHEVPKHKGGPITISSKVYIYNLDEIKEEAMDFILTAYIETTWTDERINVSSAISNNYSCSKYMWTPNLLYEEVKATFSERQIAFKINENKQLLQVIRYSFKVGCMMHFQNYPFDTQRCVFSMKLMAIFHPQAHLEWVNNGTGAIAVFQAINPLQFILKQPLPTLTMEHGMIGSRNILFVNIILLRRLTGSVINTYVPSALIVFVSWVTFWLRIEAAPARVSLSITSLLTLCTQVQHNKSQLPPLNYITALDIWLFVCIFLVFATLIEFAISYNSHIKIDPANKPERRVESRRNSSIKMWILSAGEKEVRTKELRSMSSKARRWYRYFCGTPSTDISHIDLISRKMFPLMFLLFTIVYWAHYMGVYQE